MNDLEMLNAYVDGELSPDACALVEARIVSDVALAQQVDALRQMKRQVVAMGSEYVVIQAPRSRVRARPVTIAAAAAVLCLVFLGGWLGALAFNGRAKSPSGDKIAQVLALHDDWSARLLDAAATAIDIRNFDAPELGAAGLTLISLRSDAILNGKPAVQAGYAGEHGCRLSLFRTAGSGDVQPLRVVNDGDARSATWADSSFRYALVARRLDGNRFAALADALQSMTLRLGQPASKQVIAELEGAHQPCNG
jgi:anti-sigma factor RsiW